jgi:hypothetical protein
MDLNFHYHVTHTAAREAGFNAAQAIKIAQAARYVDENKDAQCPSVQSTGELFRANTAFWSDRASIKKILEIWPVFHFLPGDFSKIVNKIKIDPDVNSTAYNLICGTGSSMSKIIVEEAKYYATSRNFDDIALYRIGIAMHVLADTFAHQRFAGFPDRRINDINKVRLTGIQPQDGLDEAHWSPVPGAEFNSVFGKKLYAYSPSGLSDNSYGYLGHGRIGHIPDIPNKVFGYKPLWSIDEPNEGDFVYQANPFEFHCAYEQMIMAMRFINNVQGTPIYEHIDKDAIFSMYYGNSGNAQGVARVFSLIEKDDTLPAIWGREMHDNPAQYQAPTDKQGFLTAASAHKQSVITHHMPLAELIREFSS